MVGGWSGPWSSWLQGEGQNWAKVIYAICAWGQLENLSVALLSQAKKFRLNIQFNIGFNIRFHIGFNIWFNIGLNIGFSILIFSSILGFESGSISGLVMGSILDSILNTILGSIFSLTFDSIFGSIFGTILSSILGSIFFQYSVRYLVKYCWGRLHKLVKCHYSITVLIHSKYIDIIQKNSYSNLTVDHYRLTRVKKLLPSYFLCALLISQQSISVLIS